jgi:hypothetical protein
MLGIWIREKRLVDLLCGSHQSSFTSSTTTTRRSTYSDLKTQLLQQRVQSTAVQHPGGCGILDLSALLVRAVVIPPSKSIPSFRHQSFLAIPFASHLRDAQSSSINILRWRRHIVVSCGWARQECRSSGEEEEFGKR